MAAGVLIRRARQGGNAFKLKKSKFRLDGQKKFFAVRDWNWLL